MRIVPRCGAVLLAIGGCASSVLAQDPELEQVVVTGTRIARADFDSASPIVSLTEKAFERTSSSTVETTINTLPQMVPAYTSTSNNPYNGGQGNIQLRGLGSTSTLVLIDGKRLIPANGTGVVDLNIIPPSLIERVEIITGGASAVYGSDAIAGVVNFRLKRTFDGVELDALWGQTTRGDGAEYGGGLTAGGGFAGGRGSVLGYVGYAERESILGAQREFSRYSLGYAGPDAGGFGPGGAFLAFGSAVIEEGRVFPLDPGQAALDSLFESYGYSGPIQNPRNFGFNDDGTVFAGGNGDPGSVLNFRGNRDPRIFNDRFYGYNVEPRNYLRLPLERAEVFARASFELSEAAELYAQGLYADYTADTQHAPTPADSVRMPVTNPFIPPDLKLLLDSRDVPTADFDFHKRLTDLGPRLSSFAYDVYQGTLGVRGSILGKWTYDAYAQIGANDQVESQSGNALRSKIEMLTFAPDGGVELCGAFDLFGIKPIPAECVAFIAVDSSNRASVDQAIVEASMTGRLHELPAGEMRAAIGVFYKHDEYHYAADPIATVFIRDGVSDIAGFNASDDVDGDDSNLDLYGELSIPLLADLPGIRSLELIAGYRYSDYESAGGVNSYKAEALYEPLEPVRLRGSYQHAVRAPSIYELYLPHLPGYFGSPVSFETPIDPCEVSSAQRNGSDSGDIEALCIAQGFAAELLAAYSDPDHAVPGFIGGNPGLDPEEADTVTFGVVFTSPFEQALFDRLQVSLDWYRIEVKDAIATIPADQLISHCFDRRFNPDFDAANSWCRTFSRDPETGDIVDVYEILRNSAGFRTSGLDVQLDGRVDLGPGELGLDWIASYVDTFEQLERSGIPARELVGTAGSGFIGTTFPQWKWSFGLTYGWQALTLDARWRYIDGMKAADPTIVPEFRIPHCDYIDLGASYDFEVGALAGLRLHAGLENATDEDPPLFPNSIGAYDSSQYDVVGRRYYVSLSYSF